MNKKSKPFIVFVCIENSCRSQIAEAYLKYFIKKKKLTIEVYSAGTAPHGINPRVIKILCEDNINISDHTSNHVNEYLNIGITHVVTVCDDAKQKCPI